MTVSLALGTFDGIHAGHRAVLSAALNANADRKVVLAFAHPPKTERGAKALMTPEQKQEQLLALGFNEVVLLDFAAVKDQPAEEFLNYLVKTYEVKALSCGFNYRFGKGASGDTALLAAFCNKHGIRLSVAEPVLFEGAPISSSRIREALEKGNAAEAAAMLGKPYAITANVLHGDARGRTLGFPTVNQQPSTLLPRFGVWHTETVVEEKRYRSLTNVGFRPSFPTEAPGMETYLLDYNGDLYGKTVSVAFLDYLREERKFSSAEDLIAAIRADVAQCEE